MREEISKTPQEIRSSLRRNNFHVVPPGYTLAFKPRLILRKGWGQSPIFALRKDGDCYVPMLHCAWCGELAPHVPAAPLPDTRACAYCGTVRRYGNTIDKVAPLQ